MNITASRPRAIILRTAAIAVGVGALAAALAGCRPEPAAPTGSASPTSAVPSESATTSPEPSPSATSPAGDIALPQSCDELYSAPFRATLEGAIAPLNDPGVTMYSTEVAEGLETLDAGVPQLRCTWGTPSERGIATTVAIIDAGQSAVLLAALPQAGFACSDLAGGTVCEVTQTLFGADGEPVEKVESHFFRGNGWVSTVLLDYPADGYTEDVATTLWG